MRQDLDRLMQERGIDALWITGSAQHNPPMTYFTGAAHVTVADLIVPRGRAPTLFHYPMEREEAARTGIACRSYGEFRIDDLLREAGGDRVRAAAARMQRVFRETGVTGRVAVMGRVESGALTALIDELRRDAPGVELVGDREPSLLMEARATKDDSEIARLRRIGRQCALLFGELKDHLAAQRMQTGVLVDREGKPVTVGAVKGWIRRRIAELGPELSEGMIFAVGRDAGIPHSTGRDADRLRAGLPIVFDFYPQEPGGGYFYDITRTWCLGFAPDRVQQVYDDVLAAYRAAVAAAKVGTPCRELQKLVCDLFEARGHPTVQHEPQTERGYVHTLGHGVGLDIHESPILSTAAGNQSVLANGMVFTIEPGLYYPEEKIGMRLEDTFRMGADGKAEPLAPFPLDLIIPMRGARKPVSGRAKKRRG